MKQQVIVNIIHVIEGIGVFTLIISTVLLIGLIVGGVFIIRSMRNNKKGK